jgi:hypothetical protein
MVRAILDTGTYATVHVLVTAANRGNQDVAEVLHEAGILLTPERARALKVQALTELLEALYTWKPSEMMRRKGGSGQTPAAMYDTVRGFVEEFRDSVK